MSRPSRHPVAVLGTAAVLIFAAVLVVVTRAPARAENNGLARTPPMGWNDWNAYGCSVSESLVEQTALDMHNNGMQAAGYEYVNIDDCWASTQRDANGNLVADPSKFPDGIAAVAAYVHSLGLKLGIYADAGTATCSGYPGSLGHEQQDADTFASWGVDYLKYDNCNSNGNYQQNYTTMSQALAAAGRPVLFSMSEWGIDSPWTWGPGVANMWRTTGDISPTFSSMLANFHANAGLAQYAGPGGWNDPDMLEVGNGMGAAQDQAEFSLWAEMAAPLIEGSNLTSASAATLSILENKAVIAVDQDSLGKQGTEIASSGGLDVLVKPLSNGDAAVVLLNENSSPATISTTAATAGLPAASSYTLNDLWAGTTSSTSGTISATVPAESVVMYRVTPVGATSTPSATPTTSATPSTPATPTATPSPTASTPQTACHVTYATQSQWPGGFVASITVTDTGSSAVNGWSLAFTFPGDQEITNAWNGTVTQKGAAVSIANDSYNGALNPGTSTSPGFQGTWTSSDAAPAAFTLNGTTCT